MGAAPDNKLTLEWLHLPDGLRALAFDERTWKAFDDRAKTRGQSAEQMIVSAVRGSLGPIHCEPDHKPTFEWLRLPDGLRALAFDEPTWTIFKTIATARGQSAEQIFITAVAASLGSILVDNYALNRFTGGFQSGGAER